AHAEWDFGFERIADGGRNSGIGNGDDDIGFDRMFFGERAAQSFTASADGAAEDDAVGARKIDMLEDALLVLLFWGEADGFQAAFRDAHHFAGLDFADVCRVEKIKGAGLRGGEPSVAEAAENQRPKAPGIADGVKLVLREHDQRIGAFDLIERVTERAGKI